MRFCIHEGWQSAGGEQGPAALPYLSRVPMQQRTEPPGLKSLAVFDEQPLRSGCGDPFGSMDPLRSMDSSEEAYESAKSEASSHGQAPPATESSPCMGLHSDCACVMTHPRLAASTVSRSAPFGKVLYACCVPHATTSSSPKPARILSRLFPSAVPRRWRHCD